jgi:hypothetical protein
MKIFKNLPTLKLPRRNSDAEDINVWDGRSVAISTPVAVNSLNVVAGSSVTFLNENRKQLPAITIASGELLLVDGDVEMIGDVVVQSGGEFRVI